MAVWSSRDEGASWAMMMNGTVDKGASGYSSLQLVGGGKLALMYEQSDADQIVMNPDRFVFRLFVIG